MISILTRLNSVPSACTLLSFYATAVHPPRSCDESVPPPGLAAVSRRARIEPRRDANPFLRAGNLMSFVRWFGPAIVLACRLFGGAVSALAAQERSLFDFADSSAVRDWAPIR